MFRLNKRLGLILCFLSSLGAAPRVLAYALETSTWVKGTAGSPTQVVMQLHMQYGPPAFPSSPLQDGSTSWNQVIIAAMTGQTAGSGLAALDGWNQYLATMQFSGVVSSQPPPTTQSSSNHNDVFFSSTIYGDSWGGTGTLGITLLIYDNNNHNIDTDVLFNNTSGINWDSFRGNLQFSKTDLRRIALHELGHSLGLAHPDDFGQTVAAIMNAAESNTDDLTADDISGGNYLYGLGPAITVQPANTTVLQGHAAALTVTPAGSGPFTYQWQKNGVNVSGATGSSLAFSGAQLTDAGNYTVIVTDSGGSTTSNTAVLTVNAPSVFTLQPVSLTNVASGFSAVFSVAAAGFPAPTFQWNLNGTPIHGATDPVYFIATAGAGSAGSYTCTAANSIGSLPSRAATLALGSASNPGYLVNISARADVGTSSNILIGGFGVAGSGSKQLLLRGVGPGLYNTFGLTGELLNPQLTLLDNNGAVIATNIGWGNSPTLGPSAGSRAPRMASASDMNAVGAFAYQSGSADTAIVVTAPTGNSTAQVSGVGSTSGIALVEIYDADTGTPTARLINISARANVGTGNNILIGGFAIGGAAAETVLIRAVGPGLTDTFGLTGTLTQPVLTLFQGSTVIYSNTGWGGDVAIASIFPSVGAFNLNAAHQDSVLLVTLQPGNYTAQVSGLSSGTGIALCEIYEVP